MLQAVVVLYMKQKANQNSSSPKKAQRCQARPRVGKRDDSARRKGETFKKILVSSTTKTDMLKRFGALSLPVILLITFSLFGTRLSQRCIHPIVNVFFVINTTVTTILAVGFAYGTLRTTALAQKLANTAFPLLAVVNLLLLYRIYFKQYNVVALLQDVSKHRNISLSKVDRMWVCATLCISIASIFYSLGVCLFALVDFLKMTEEELLEQFTFSFISAQDPLINGIIFVTVGAVFSVCNWMSFLGPCTLMSTIATVLSRELQACIENFERFIDEDGSLSEETFIKTTERFNLLTLLVKKADAMFNPFVALYLMNSLIMLCAAVFGIIVEKGILEQWLLAVVIASATVAILVPPLAALHSQVLFKFDVSI